MQKNVKNSQRDQLPFYMKFITVMIIIMYLFLTPLNCHPFEIRIDWTGSVKTTSVESLF